MPELNSSITSDYLLALGTLDKRMLILLDIEELMASAESGACGANAAVLSPYNKPSLSAVKRLIDNMGKIGAASIEQSAGVTQVGEAVSQIDQTTQQNAALVEASASGADELKVQAVTVFKLRYRDVHDAEMVRHALAPIIVPRRLGAALRHRHECGAIGLDGHRRARLAGWTWPRARHEDRHRRLGVVPSLLSQQGGRLALKLSAPI